MTNSVNKSWRGNNFLCTVKKYLSTLQHRDHSVFFSGLGRLTARLLALVALLAVLLLLVVLLPATAVVLLSSTPLLFLIGLLLLLLLLVVLLLPFGWPNEEAEREHAKEESLQGPGNGDQGVQPIPVALVHSHKCLQQVQGGEGQQTGGVGESIEYVLVNGKNKHAGNCKDDHYINPKHHSLITQTIFANIS